MPHHQLVVVAAAGKLRPVWRVLEAADLLLVRCQRPEGLLGHAHVSVADGAVSGPSGQDVVVPSQRTDSRRVALEGAQELVDFCIPDFDDARVASNGYVWSFLLPADAGDAVLSLMNVAELGDFGGGSAPQVDAAAEADAEHVG